MATDETSIQKMEAKLTKLKDTLTKYGDMFNADGHIDTEEQRQIDSMQAIVSKATSKLEELKAEETEPELGKIKKGGPVSDDDSEDIAPSSGGNKFTKAFYDGEKAKKYEIYIHVDQPGKGGDRDTYEGNGITEDVDVGHTYVRMVKTNDDGSVVENTFGFYPKESVNPITGPIEVQGILYDDKGHEYEVKANKELTHKQFFDALTYVENNHNNKYNLDTYNCTDFAIETAGAAAWNIKSKKGSWPGGSGRNPGDLGEDLR